MKGFRIIAIKTGNKPTAKSSSSLVKDNDFLKVLSPNTFYPFYTHYEFIDNKTIRYNPESDIDIYNLKGQNDISININAIVGSNGSGKSTLIELINWANYNIGCYLKLFKSEKNNKLEPLSFLDFELIYSVEKKLFYKYIFSDSNIYIVKSIISKSNDVVFEEKHRTILTLENLPEFFYSIIVNYSHYALNSEETGTWINQLFHKNDGYQTPLVLNPMRTRGNFDVNKEKRLLTKRLQANLLERVEVGNELNSLRNLVNGKIATEFELSLFDYLSSKNKDDDKDDDDKVYFNRKSLSFDKYESNGTQIPNNEISTILKSINKYFEMELSYEKIQNDDFLKYSFEYIQYKLFKISRKYKQYRKYKTQPNDLANIKYIDAYIKRIKESSSHIIFKVKGAILYVKYYDKIFKNKKILRDRNKQNLSYPKFKLNINELSDICALIKKEEKYYVNTSILVPPSIFETKILFDNNYTFDSLSSGEKQKIHSISSIVYHLVNLNSVERYEEDEDNYIHYRYLNIILDEIELYYHPDWQRRYISDLLDYIGKINPDNLSTFKGINITFLTHSPYILSDIPNTNILYLEQGGDTSKDKNDFKTLGANIHEMLTNSFFMDKTIGEYSISLIQEIIDFHSRVSKATEKDFAALNVEYKEKEHYLKYIANNIGENYIRGILRNHIEKIEKKLGVWSDDEEFKKLENKYLYLKSIRDDKNKIPN